MRVLLGGLVGAVVSAAAWFFLEYVTMKELGFLALGVGLITGLCIHAAAGAGAAESYGRGALAVVLTMLAIVGGRAAYVKVMQSISKVTTIAPAEEVAGVAEDEAEEAGQVEAVGEPEVPEAVRAGDTGRMRTKLQKPTVNDYKEMEVVWMALAALGAYVFGKGSGKPAPPEAASSATDGKAGTPA